MKFAKKLIAALIAMAMVAGLMACGEKGGEIEETSEAQTTTAAEKETTTAAEEETFAEEGDGIDRSETLNLVLYVTGNEPTDMAMVEEAFNKLLLEKFNVTLDIQFSTWTDYVTKYNNILVTGGADMVYTASWLDYQTLAAKGAYMALDDLLPVYAPELNDFVGTAKFDACRINGKIYCVPAMWEEYTNGGIVYRKDLAEKYDVAEPVDTVENLEEYFNKMVEKADEIGLTGLFEATGSTNTTNTLWDSSSALLAYTWGAKPYDTMDYGYVYDANNPSELVDYYASEQFVEDAKKLKEWCDNGWWSKSILAATADTESLTDGTNVATVSGVNPNKYIGWKRDIATNGVEGAELAFYAYANMSGNAYPGLIIGNGTALTNDCQSPERCMEVLNYIMMDGEMNALIQCGIEGTHYDIDENGFYVPTQQGLDCYPFEAANTWNLRNDTVMLKKEADIELNEIFAGLAEISSKKLYPFIHVAGGFGEDYTEYETERMAVLAILEKHCAPLFAGLVEDPEAAVEAFRAELAASEDWTACREAYVAQWTAYCEEYGYTDSVK